ncbi:hypothetical protein [Burkholderia vietnamiensis]|nr:hypothetical protein [Burkholderia vietnamiensis]MDN7814696.1 hypothetical protein [Burkholderia vietnamiensis]MDN8042357.1 hypothetical protein [Burkholderia vietnamiensis]
MTSAFIGLVLGLITGWLWGYDIGYWDRVTDENSARLRNRIYQEN